MQEKRKGHYISDVRPRKRKFARRVRVLALKVTKLSHFGGLTTKSIFENENCTHVHPQSTFHFQGPSTKWCYICLIDLIEVEFYRFNL